MQRITFLRKQKESLLIVNCSSLENYHANPNPTVNLASNQTDNTLALIGQ